MIATVAQRWRDRRDSYRPAGEPIDPRLYEVARIANDNGAKPFVTRHHYSGSYPAARFRFGLYRRAELVGVAVFSVPVNDAAVTNVFPVKATDATDLGRFVLLDDVPANGESWFLARCFEELRRDVAGVISFADPMARATADGATVHPGHVGTIYQATNAVYLGRATPRTLRILPDGRVLSARAIQKLRAGERGRVYVAGLLAAHGAAGLEDLRRVTRTVRHAGNHKYAWALDRALRRHLPDGRPYPKVPDARL